MAKSSSSKSSSSKKTPSKKTSSAKKTSTQKAVPPARKGTRHKPTPPALKPIPKTPGLIDESTKRTIIAIVCVVAAIALMLMILWPSDAYVASWMSLALHRFLGVGVYILPVLLLVVGATFVVRFENERVPIRVILGLALVYFGILVLIALFSPGAVDGRGVSTELFSDANVVARGGYLGAGPAFLLLMLLGLPISVIIALGIIAVGLAIIGFSVGKVAALVGSKRAAKRAAEEAALDVVPASPYVPMTQAIGSTMAPRKGVDSRAATHLIGEETAIEDAETIAIPPSDRLSQSLEGHSTRHSGPLGESPALTRRLGKSPKDLAAEIPEVEPQKKKTKPKKEPLLQKSPDDSFELPDPSLLHVGKGKVRTKAFEEELRTTAMNLQQTMEDFGIMAEVVDWIAGPTVTLFEVDLPPGVRVNKLSNLKDDIALALAAPGVRIFAPIPNTHYVGIEVPNVSRENVLLGDILKNVDGGPLSVAIGKDVEGNPIIEDLTRMPHLLIGGTTGSGKSVGINAMIMSILMRATPSQVRFIMIDPKRVEFAPYDGIPHLYVPVVTEPKEAASALAWGVAEMELRLKTFQKSGVRNISSYNSLVVSGKLRSLIDEGAIESKGFPQPDYIDTPMPYIVIVIDELADLMMNVGKEVEFSISRIAQLARAAGIHLIVATQRPSANIVTGLIKANITTRIAYNVASGLDSRVILDTTGAESLIGLGDLLISKPELGKPLRVQGCFTSDEEIASVVEFIKAQGSPEYHTEILKTNTISLGDSSPDGSGGTEGGDDPLIWEAAEIVVATGLGSTSNIQRKLKVGYARAGRIMDMLEEKGVVGPPNGSKPRDVLVDALELETLKAFEGSDGDE